MTIYYRLCAVLIFFVALTQSQAQTNQDVDDVVSDLILLSQSYINPAAIGVSYQASAGWYTTAVKKEQWHLELSLQGGVLMLPEKFQTFSINQSQLKNLSVLNSGETVTFPTAIGGTAISELQGSINGDPFNFDAPEGIDEDYVGQVQVQAALTVLDGTTIVARFSPKVKVKETSYNTFGVGVHQNLSQWFVAEDSDFSLGALVAYSNFNVEDSFSNINVVIGNLNAVAVQGDSFTYQLTATQQINKCSVSGALGVISSKFNYEVGGDGDLILTILNGVLNNSKNTNSEFKADVSVDYKFSDFSINAMATVGAFTSLTLGFNYNL